VPNFIYFLISFTSFCGISLLLKRKLRIKLSFSFIFGISIIVFSLFIFGVLDLLSEGVILLNLSGIIFFFYFILKDRKKISSIDLKLYLLPIFLILLWFTISNFLFIKEWDEFYWGQFVKAIFYEKELWNINSSVINIRWLPGISLFQTYFIYFNETYSENTVIFASGLIFFISIFCLFNLRSYHSNILILILALLTVLFLDRMPGTLYMEVYLATLFFIYFYYLVFFLKRNTEYYLFPVLLFALTLLKIHGLFLSAIILVIFYFKMINHRNLFFKMFPEIFFILILIGIFSLNNLWSYHLGKNYFNDLTDFHNYSTIIELLYKDFFENNFYILKKLTYGLSSADLLNNKGRQLFSEIDNFIPSPLIYFFSIFLLNFYLSFNKNKHQSFLKLLFYLGFFGFLFLPYIFMLYMDDNHGMGSDDGFSGALRYSKLYLLSLTFFLLFELITFFKEKKVLKYFSYLLCLFSIIFISFFYGKINYYSKIVTMRISEQKHFNTNHKKISKNLKKLLNQNDRVFYINYGTDGYEAMSFRYHLAPFLSNNFNFSIGPKVDEDDIWTHPYNNLDLIEALNLDFIYEAKLDFIKKKNLDLEDQISKKYFTYIFVENTYDKFYQDYNILFENKNFKTKNALFKILRENDIIIGVVEINFN